MLKPRDRQIGFYDADYVCEQLIPSDSFYRKFREIVEPLIEDEHFETMYCWDNGWPAISPALLAMATILQFYKNLSDREMERACMYDIEVKYALGLRLNERPFDHSSLGDFRKRLLENGKEKETFERILGHLVEKGLIQKDEIQRIDATHVIADIAIPTMVTLVWRARLQIWAKKWRYTMIANRKVEEIYVYLIGENVDVWRPVKAEKIQEAIYRILEQPYDRDSEKWEFEPGETVICEYVNSEEGKILAARKKA